MDSFEFSTLVVGGEETMLKYFLDHGLIIKEPSVSRTYTQVKKRILDHICLVLYQLQEQTGSVQGHVL